MSTTDILGDLSDLDDTMTDSPSKEQLYQLYGIYLNDFVKNTLIIDGFKVLVNNNIVNDGKRYDKILIKKQESFCHISTREVGNSKRRTIRAERANKIHWIRPILENCNDTRIKYFEGLNDRNEYCRFYWYKEKSYIVILKEIRVNVMLVTGYCVDGTEVGRFNEKHQTYLREVQKQKNLPLR